VHEDRERVVTLLEQGICDAILPAVPRLLDGFAQFLLDHGVMEYFERFPDARVRRSIPAFFFGHLLLVHRLLRLPSLRQLPAVLFRSAAVLRTLGFNLVQIEQGFYANGSQRPCDEEAIAEFFAGLPASALEAHQRELSNHLIDEFPALGESGVFFLDGSKVSLPGARGHQASSFLVCVLCAQVSERAVPVRWSFHPHDVGSELPAGKALMAGALAEWPAGTVRVLVADGGYLSGAWIAELKGRGVDVVIKVRENMSIYADVLGLSRLGDARWHPAPPPQRTGETITREVAFFSGLESWEGCPLALCACLVRDRCPGWAEPRYQVIVSTVPPQRVTEVLGLQRARWAEEESFMALTRYWGIERQTGGRRSLSRAKIHFTLLAYALAALFVDQFQQQPLSPPVLTPQHEQVVYAGGCYAVLYLSEILDLVFAHYDIWRERWPALREQLRRAERPP